MKAYAYLRVSSIGQVEGDGFDRQKQTITGYCSNNDISISKFYEESESGTKEDRTVLTQLLIDIESNGVRTVIIEKLDRLARDLMVQEIILKDFKERGITLISVLEGDDINGNDPTRKLIRQVLGAFAEYEKTMLVLKMKVARDRIKARGIKCGGAKRFGEESDSEQEVVNKIKHMRKSMTLQAIADELNGEGIPTKRGYRWDATRVRRVLI